MSSESIFTVLDEVWNKTASENTNDNIIKLKAVVAVLPKTNLLDLMEMAGQENRTIDEALYRAAVQMTRIIVNSDYQAGFRFAAMDVLGVLSERGLPCRDAFKIGLSELSENENVPVIKQAVTALIARIIDNPQRVYRGPRFVNSPVVAS